MYIYVYIICILKLNVRESLMKAVNYSNEVHFGPDKREVLKQYAFIGKLWF